MMERKFARFFHRLVQELIPDNGQRDQLFDALRKYQSSQKLHQLLLDLQQILDEPDKLELFEFIRPLILLRHQMEYSYLTPPAPGVRLRTIRLHRSPNQSLGFAVRGGYEFSVGVFVSKVEPGTQAEKQGLKVGDEIVRVNGFTIAEAIHDDVLNLIKSRDEIVLKVTHIGMLPVKERVSDAVTWQYVEDMDSKRALDEVLAEKQVHGGKGVELKIFIDCTGYDSIGCGILSGPHYYPGIFVEKVRPGSLAQEVGLEVGDQIVEVNDSSFQNIGHKEAVVVLKGSKQLNVIIRKHAGLPLFEQRQTPSRGSSGTGVSSHPPSNSSPPGSQRSIPSSRPPADNGGLDEDQLIAEQLSRTSLVRTTTTTTHSFGPLPDSLPRQSSTDSHMISTLAEVHSDSDSYHGSAGDGPLVPIEEPLPADLPTPTSLSPPSSLTSTLSLSLPDRLDTASKAAPSEQFAYHPPTTTTTTSDPDPASLSLPDDLGDPVLAALQRPIYPADTPPWVVPRMYVSDLHSSISLRGETDSAELSRNVKSLDGSVQSMGEKGGGKVDHDLNSLGGGLDHSSEQRIEIFQGEDLVEQVGVNEEDQEEVLSHRHAKDSEVKTDTDVVRSDIASPQVDENSNIMEVGSQGLQSGSEFPEAVTVSAAGVVKEVDNNRFSTERSDPPVFVPPPPPSSPPPPTISSASEHRSLRVSPTHSRQSSISTQTAQQEEGEARLDDIFEAVLEFGSETDESTHSDRGIATGEIKDGEEFSSWGKDDDHVAESFTGRDGSGTSFSLAETGSQHYVNTADFPGDVPKLALDSDCSPKRSEDEIVGEEDSVTSQVSAESHQRVGAGSEFIDIHNLPPPPASFFKGESSDDKDTFIPDTLTDIITVKNITTQSPPWYPPPTQAFPSPPPPSSSGVLGGAAAVLAARREAQEEERSPRLLGPAEPGLRGEALGGVGVCCPHDLLATWFNPLELDGRELKSFNFPKNQSLGVALEGGTGTPLAGRVVVAAVFGSGAAVEHGLQTGDQLMMINGHKLTDISVAEAEQILEHAYAGPKDMIQVVYAQSNFLNDEECVTYF